MLSLIVNPRMAGRVFGPDDPYYTARFYPELAAALSDLLGSEVPILHNTLDGAPAEGWILADQEGDPRELLTRFSALCPRVILMGADAHLTDGDLFTLVKEFGLAGAVGVSTSLDWRRGFPCPPGRGFVGHVDRIESAGLSVLLASQQDPSIGEMFGYPDLATGIAQYLGLVVCDS